MPDQETQHRRTIRFGVLLIGTFIVLMIVTNWMAPRYPAPSGPTYYYPDPTPRPVYHTEINIGSHNCIGWNVSC